MNILDLFCGCGGFSLGFKQAGFKVKYGIDNWEGCKETFEYNHPNTKFILEDIRELKPRKFRKVDIIIGSPPCQEFSNANNNPNIDKGMELIHIFFEWVKKIKPKYWIMENVPNIKKWLKWRIINFKIPKIKVFNCADFGVPQIRKRCFSGEYPNPKQIYAKIEQINLFGNKLKKWLTVWDAIGDLMFIEPNQKLKDRICSDIMLKKHPPQKLNKISSTIKTKTGRPEMFLELSNHQCYNFNEEKNKPEFVGNWQGLKKIDINKPSFTITDNHGNTNLIPNHNCFDNLKDYNYESSNRKIRLEKPSFTIDSKNRCSKKLEILNSFSLNNKGHQPYNSLNTHNQCLTSISPSLTNRKKVYRRLTVRECLRLQGFPDDFILFGSLTSQYKMTGNAVPPPMAKALALAIKNEVSN